MAVLLRKLKTLFHVLKKGGPGAAWSILIRRTLQRSRQLRGGLLRVGTCVFRCPDEESRELIVDGDYETSELFAVKHFVRRDLPVVEFGGSLGVVACLVNRRLRNRRNHVVVEANPALVPVLSENRDRNRSGFEVLHAAAGARDATVRIHLGRGSLHSSSIKVTENFVDVPGIKLATILKEHGFDRCTLVCDIEGAESLLIRDEIAIFQAQVETLIIEFHPAINGSDDVDASRQLLLEHGFQSVWSDRDTVVFKNSQLS